MSKHDMQWLTFDIMSKSGGYVMATVNATRPDAIKTMLRLNESAIPFVLRDVSDAPTPYEALR